ncbi:hypothetical protein KUV89_16960 [Marinobacter hydrocarbonoclasticus]|nr:hypothetical protein [Marinobacter nauticus]
MMNNLESFEKNPWGKTLHYKYSESFFHVSPSPETVTGEILLASLYRRVGFQGAGNEAVKEIVRELGTQFLNQVQKKGKRPGNTDSPTEIDLSLWQNIVTRSITSPKLPNQSKHRGQQMSPIVPDAAMYSMSARLRGKPWNPGKLVCNIIALGSDNEEQALEIWQLLYDGLSVDQKKDDIWARMLQVEFESWRSDKVKRAWSKPSTIPADKKMFPGDFKVTCPAKAFVADLRVVLSAKEQLTRRQWVTLLESLCRIGTSAHVMWLCNANDWCYQTFEKALKKGEALDQATIEDALSSIPASWSIGQRAKNTIMDTARRYITGRCAMNLLLYMLEDAGFDMDKIDLGSPARLASTLEYLAKDRQKLDFKDYQRKLTEVMERDNRVVACKSGTSKNVLEFLEHVTRQRITSEPGLESYDQGFYLQKKGSHSSAPWVVGLGPLSVLLMVHCANSRNQGPCTVNALAKQLAKYGIDVGTQLGQGGSLTTSLRDMSIAVDSPDAEGGMVLVSPLAMAGK